MSLTPDQREALDIVLAAGDFDTVAHHIEFLLEQAEQEAEQRARRQAGRETVNPTAKTSELQKSFTGQSWFEHLTTHQQLCALGSITSEILATEQAVEKRLREPGPCGKHPMTYWEHKHWRPCYDVAGPAHGVSIICDHEPNHCSACESEAQKLTELRERCAMRVELLAGGHWGGKFVKEIAEVIRALPLEGER